MNQKTKQLLIDIFKMVVESMLPWWLVLPYKIYKRLCKYVKNQD